MATFQGYGSATVVVKPHGGERVRRGYRPPPDRPDVQRRDVGAAESPLPVQQLAQPLVQSLASRAPAWARPRAHSASQGPPQAAKRDGIAPSAVPGPLRTAR
ncbi:MAG: hypothetical protein ACXVGQ_11020, partial [Mycobacteriaceae bacterium]